MVVVHDETDNELSAFEGLAEAAHRDQENLEVIDAGMEVEFASERTSEGDSEGLEPPPPGKPDYKARG